MDEDESGEVEVVEADDGAADMDEFEAADGAAYMDELEVDEYKVLEAAEANEIDSERILTMVCMEC